MEADIQLDSIGLTHFSLIFFLLPEHWCFPGACLHNDPFWMPKCTRGPLVRQLHVQESPKPGPDQARKSLRNQLSAFLVDVFVTFYKQTDLKVKTQILQMHTNPTTLCWKSQKGLVKLILTSVLPVDEICLSYLFG